MASKKFDITQHRLVPKHTVVSDRELKQLLKHYSLKDFPKILIDDPAIHSLKVKEGDIIKIERQSLTAGKTVFFRRVVNA